MCKQNKHQREQVSQWVILQKRGDGQIRGNSGIERLERIVFRGKKVKLN